MYDIPYPVASRTWRLEQNNSHMPSMINTKVISKDMSNRELGISEHVECVCVSA